MADVHDLRSALEYLKTQPGQLLETDTEVDPDSEVCGVYRHIGAGGTVERPTKLGPAMVFNNVKGFPGSRVAIGLLADRGRVAKLLNMSEEFLGRDMGKMLDCAIAPQMIEEGKHIDCQEVVYKATDPDFDLRKLVPAPTNTPEDAGPYITMGLCMGHDPKDTMSDVTIHRLCIESKDELGMFITPGSRHLGAFLDQWDAEGKDMPISINIGLDPAVYMASCFEAPTTPLGYNELQIAGGIRQKPVELANCLTVPEKCIANAEYVLEGYIQHGRTLVEDMNTHTGKAMPEFPGYTGKANPAVRVIKITAVTTRRNPIMESCIGPSHEHVSMAGIPTEASIFKMIDQAMPGRLINVHAAPCGGGKLVAVLQFKKSKASDEGRQRNAAMLAFSAFGELKHVFLVDPDVDIFDMNDVMWAMATRFQADQDVITIPGTHCHVLVPCNDPKFDPTCLVHGMACKAIFDCTVPFELQDTFKRAQFMDIDEDKWAKELAF